MAVFEKFSNIVIIFLWEMMQFQKKALQGRPP